MTRLLLLLLSAGVLSGCAVRQAPLSDFTANSGAQRSAEQLLLTLENVDLSLRVDPATRSIVGDASLRLLTAAPIDKIALELDRNLPIDSVSVDGVALPAHAFSNPDGRLTLTLPHTLGGGQTALVRLHYHGTPHVAKHAPWDGGFVWSHSAGGEDWIATAVQGEGCDLFWPCIDHPMGKPQLMTLHISVPAPLVVAGNGVALGMDEHAGWRTYHWRIKHPNTYGIALNIGAYDVIKGSYASRYGNQIALAMWHLPGHAAQAQALVGEFAPMLDFFESRIGPYPFGDEKMGVVETPHKGMEHQTINAYGNEFEKSPYGYDWLLQHEFSHEWFGNQLTNANWDDMWLHEGFGSYMQPLYLEYLRGELAFHAALQEQRQQIDNKFPIVTGKPMRAEDVYQAERGGAGQDIYNKGSLVLHTLRNLIGDDAFFRATRRLVYGRDDPAPGNFAPRYGSTPEFIGIVNAVSGRDLGWFFDAYLYHAELPELLATREGSRLQLTWKLKHEARFPMPVEVRVNDHIETLTMTDGHGELTLPANATYTLDPHDKVLRVQAYLDEWKLDRAQRRKKK